MIPLADRRDPFSSGGAEPTGASDDEGYNLESFVSAETTLADHLAEQMTLAISEPARRAAESTVPVGLLYVVAA